MSSNRCCVFIARIDLAKIMKLMLRVSSESKYSFFNRKVIEHIVEKMDVVVWSTEAELFLSGSREERVWSSKLGCKSCLCCGSSSSKAGLYFVEGWLLRRQTLQAGHFFRGVFLKSMNARAVNYSENSSETMQLTSSRWSISVTWALKGVEMETTFSIFETVAEVKFSFVLNVAFPGRRKHCWSFPEFSFRSWGRVNWTDRSLSSFSEKKNVTSNRCRALQS